MQHRHERFEFIHFPWAEHWQKYSKSSSFSENRSLMQAFGVASAAHWRLISLLNDAYKNDVPDHHKGVTNSCYKPIQQDTTRIRWLQLPYWPSKLNHLDWTLLPDQIDPPLIVTSRYTLSLNLLLHFIQSLTHLLQGLLTRSWWHEHTLLKLVNNPPEKVTK